MAVSDKLQSILDSKAAIKAAIEAKGVTDVGDVLSTYADKIASIQTGGGGTTSWTGHADTEGLKAIGWSDDDIAYYQAHGVNWNEEDDEYHKVPQDNIDLYGVLTADNISEYKDRIVYSPKINTSGRESLNGMFNSCLSLVAIPMIDTSSVTDMNNMFLNCRSLTTVPHFNTSNVTDMSYMFWGCYTLTHVPLFDTSSVTDMRSMFYLCTSITHVPLFDTSSVTDMRSMFYSCTALLSVQLPDTSSVTDMNQMFYLCPSLISISLSNTSNVTNMGSMFKNCSSLIYLSQLDAGSVTKLLDMLNDCSSLRTVNIKKLKKSLPISNTSLLVKDSLLYIINNEAATSPITITLSAYCYNKYSTDSDVTAALANHPNISLASA